MKFYAPERIQLETGRILASGEWHELFGREIKDPTVQRILNSYIE